MKNFGFCKQGWLRPWLLLCLFFCSCSGLKEAGWVELESRWEVAVLLEKGSKLEGLELGRLDIVSVTDEGFENSGGTYRFVQPLRDRAEFLMLKHRLLSMGALDVALVKRVE